VRWLAPAALALLLAATPAAHAAGLGFEQRFSSRQPGTSTGARIHLVYPDYGGKPKAQARLVISLPEGTRFDESVVPACPAANEDFFVQGRGACAPESQVGAGTGSAATGFGPPVDPVAAEGRVFHGPGSLINVFTAPGTDRVLVVSRVHISGSTLTDVVAQDTPSSSPGGPPDGQTNGKEVDLTVQTRGMFLTTPPECPGTGAWTAHAVVTYTDGTSDSGTSTTPCERMAAPAPSKKRHRRKRHRRKRHHRHHHSHHHRHRATKPTK
jgi:hypothetical protein